MRGGGCFPECIRWSKANESIGYNSLGLLLPALPMVAFFSLCRHFTALSPRLKSTVLVSVAAWADY